MNTDHISAGTAGHSRKWVGTDLTGLPSGSDCLLLGPLLLPPLSSPFFMLASSSSTSSPSRRLNWLSSSYDDSSCSRHDVSSALQPASYSKQDVSPEQGLCEATQQGCPPEHLAVPRRPEIAPSSAQQQLQHARQRGSCLSFTTVNNKQ